MTGHLTDIVVPEALVGSFHADGELRINFYVMAGAVVRMEVINLAQPHQIHLLFSRENATEIAEILMRAVQPTESA